MTLDEKIQALAVKTAAELAAPRWLNGVETREDLASMDTGIIRAALSAACQLQRAADVAALREEAAGIACDQTGIRARTNGWDKCLERAAAAIAAGGERKG